MNKYITQGKGRNRSENPRPFLYHAGFGQRLLASAIPEMRTALVHALPHQLPEVKSLRARRREGEDIPRQAPQGMQSAPAAPRWVRRAQYGLAYGASERTLRNLFPEGRAQWDSESIGRLYGDLRDYAREHAFRIVTPTAEQRAELSRALDVDRAQGRDRTGIFVINSITGRLNSTEPRLLHRILRDAHIRFLPDEQPRGIGHWTTALAEAFRLLTPEEQEAANKAEEERKLKERLAGREVGQVIRRPKRTIAGIPIIDVMAEDGTVARTIVKSGKE
jgi:hypothetical protein